MRIKGIHVTGFGRIDGLELTGLDHPLVVIGGPNGSGKTSLMEFVSGVLTGFPRGNTRRRKYPPTGSSLHGGSLELTVEGHGARIARYLPGNDLEVTGATPATERVKSRLESLSPTFYRGLLAFDVDALSHLELMSDREINDLVYGAGSTASGVSPRRVVESLRARASEIYLPRGRRPELNRRLEDLDRARAELRACLNDSGDTTRLRSRIAELEGELDALRAERNRLTAERWRLETAVSLWSGHVRAGEDRRAANKILARVPGEILERVEERRPVVEAALTQAGALKGTEERVAELSARLLRLRSQARNARTLLGEDWTEERVRGTLVPLTEVAEGEARWTALSEAASEVERLRGGLAEATARLADAVAARDRVRTATADQGPEPESVEGRARVIRALGDELINIDRLLAASASPREDGAGHFSPTRLRTVTAVIITALGSLGGGWLLASDRLGPAVGVLALTFPLVLLLSGALSPVGNRPPGSDVEHLRCRRRELATRLRTEAEWMGLGITPDSGRRTAHSGLDTLPVTAIINHADRMEGEAAAAREAEREVHEADAALEMIRRGVEEARSRHREAVVAWRDWCARLGLPDSLTGPTMEIFVARLGEARRLGVEIEATEEEIADLERRREMAMARVAALHSELVGGGDNVDGGSPDPRTALGELLVMSEEFARLTSQLGNWSLRVREQAGDRTEEILATLAGNDPELWRDRLDHIDGEISGIERGIEHLAGELRAARDELQHLELSTEIAERTQEVTTLEDDAVELWNRYRALVTAAELVEETLDRHEARRQPEVVRAASAIFSRVTAGAYTDLIVREGAVSVVDATGGENSPPALSRGTVEQLYLSLRLALIETFVRRQPVPVVLDEVLVDFDPIRRAAMIKEVISLSLVTQVIVLTCHPRTVEEFLNLAPRAHHVRLETIGPGRDRSQSSPPPSPPFCS